MPTGIHNPTNSVEKVVGVQFGIYSPEEIVKRSVVEITNNNTYEGNEPKIGGLFDPRMGVLENGKTCRSCGQTNHGCPGHFGHYRLARPVYFSQFFNYVIKTLQCVCIRCSKLLIDKEANAHLLKKRPEARWNEVRALCAKISRCGQANGDGCGTSKPESFKSEGVFSIVAEWGAAAKEGEGDTVRRIRQTLEVEYVQRLFRAITDEDVEFMGFPHHWCRPDWMICSVLPIPPPQVRPSVVQDNNQRSEDDLTYILFEIIKANKQLQDAIDKNKDRKQIDMCTTIVQYNVAILVNNKIPGIPPSAQRGGRPLKSLQQRIGSKEGRVRYNIQGKRVEQSARTVITPDPNLSIAEVGVPLKIAMNLSRPEKVTIYNREKLYRYVQNGADKFPGAKSVVRADGRMISLKHVNTAEVVLKLGDTVHRHLMDGDVILFNRQPTLHRMSMMGHRVRVLPFNTFRLNVSVCSAYNADFDGDEMNAHVPQSSEAHTELQEIAAVPMQIIRPRDGQPVIGVVQDTLVGAHLVTKPNNFFNRREFMNLMMRNRRFEGLPQTGSVPKYTGQQVISTMLSPINMKMNNSMYSETKSPENTVIIEQGQVKQGIFDKGIFNKPGSGIIHTTYNDYGAKETVNLIDGLQNVLENYLVMKGFSVGISDLIADEGTKKQMEEKIAESKKEVADIAMQVHMDLFTNNTGKSNQEEFENRVNGALGRAADSGKIGQKSLSDENRLIAMIRAGSKGGPMNIAQMIACVGQQNPEGKRIPYGFADRTLPHYKKFDDGPEARGFVESSFLRGLNPQEFFFHAMSGREGLIDTAVKTSETGYTQRQLIKAMEDLMIQHDGTVRDAVGNVVQFYYGEDGTNSTKIESSAVPLDKDYDKTTDADIRARYSLSNADLGPILKADTDRAQDQDALAVYAEQVVQDRRMLIEKIFGFSKNSPPVSTPLNLERIILNIKIKFAIDKSAQTDLTPYSVIQGIEQMIKKTQPHNQLWAASLRYFCAPHRIIIDERFTVAAWEALVETVVVKNMKSWAVPGELVGIIAAQSIGEPTTQLTLNTFHLAGVAAKSNMTRGVPRVKELLKATDKPKATSITVYLKPEFRNNKDAVREVMQDLELTLLKDIVLKSAIYYDPKDAETVIEEDRDLINFYNMFEAGDMNKLSSKWLLRLTFDRELMFNKNITMDDVNVILTDRFADSISITYSDYNSQKLIMRIRINTTDGVYGDHLEGLKKFQNNVLNSIIVRGVPGIRACTFRRYGDMLEYDGSVYKPVEQYIIDTDGANYGEILAHPAVDGTKLYSTNVHDMYEYLGIEATRQCLHTELRAVFEEAGVNYRHMGILCDVMTHKGKLMSIDRHGINKNNIGPLAKASFEETQEVLLKAALFGEVDPVVGVSANIMMGQPIRGGTGFSQIMLDEVALPRLLSGLPAVAGEEEDEELDLDQANINAALYEDANDACSSTRLAMNFTLPRAQAVIEEEDVDWVVA